MPLVVYYILFMDDLKTGVLAIRINEGLEDDALVALNAKSKTGKKKQPTLAQIIKRVLFIHHKGV